MYINIEKRLNETWKNNPKQITQNHLLLSYVVNQNLHGEMSSSLNVAENVKGAHCCVLFMTVGRVRWPCPAKAQGVQALPFNECSTSMVHSCWQCVINTWWNCLLLCLSVCEGRYAYTEKGSPWENVRVDSSVYTEKWPCSSTCHTLSLSRTHTRNLPDLHLPPTSGVYQFLYHFL